jgi:hypothetical protein
MLKMWHLELPHNYSRIKVNTLATQLFLNNGTYTYHYKMYNIDIKHLTTGT